MMDEEYGEIRIHRRLIKEIEERIDQTEFESVEEYVTFVLEEVVRDEDDCEEEVGDVFSEEDEAKVKERLRALGYLE